MSKFEKLLERFLKRPKDFTYDELVRLLSAFGYIGDSKGKTSGSRMIFYNERLQHPIMLHKPHPGNILKQYQIKDIMKELKDKNVL